MLKNLEVLWLAGVVVNGQKVSHGAGASCPRLVRDLVMGVEERASGFLEIPMRFKCCLSSKEGTDGVLRTQSNMYQFLVEDIRGRDRKDHVWAGI